MKRASIIFFVFLLNQSFCLAMHEKHYDEGYDSEDEQNWEYVSKEYPKKQPKDGQILIPFFRGVHCFTDRFPGKEKFKFLNDQQVGEGVFSPASFDQLGLEYAHHDLSMKKAIRKKALEIRSNNIRKQFDELKEKNPVIINGKEFKNQQIGFYYLYVKSYDSCLERLKNHTLLPGESLKEIVSNLIASTAELPEHPILYAAGLKIAGKVLRPEFDAQGKPKNPYLGKVYTILIPYQDIENMGLFRVLEAYACNEMPVNCRIVNECESGFAGGIPGKYVVSEHVVRVPNFEHAWKKEHEKKYGLTKRIYDNIRKEILATEGNMEQQEKIYEKLMHQIINHNYRQKPHDHTLATQLLDRATHEALLREATLQFLDFRRLPTSTKPSVEEAKKMRKEV